MVPASPFAGRSLCGFRFFLPMVWIHPGNDPRSFGALRERRFQFQQPDRPAGLPRLGETAQRTARVCRASRFRNIPGILGGIGGRRYSGSTPRGLSSKTKNGRSISKLDNRCQEEITNGNIFLAPAVKLLIKLGVGTSRRCGRLRERLRTWWRRERELRAATVRERRNARQRLTVRPKTWNAHWVRLVDPSWISPHIPNRGSL